MTVFEINIKASEKSSNNVIFNGKGDDLANIIHKDDTIYTLKQKIAYRLKDEGVSVNELYIYYETSDYYDFIKAENQMINNNNTINSETLKLLNGNITDKQAMFKYNANAITFPTDKINTTLTFYKPLSVHCLDDDGNYDHIFTVDPFKLTTLTKTDGIELYGSSKNSILRNSERLINCNFKTNGEKIVITVIKIQDILQHIEKNKLNVDPRRLIELYFPYFKKYALFTSNSIDENRMALKMELKEKNEYFWKANELIDKYNTFDVKSSEIKSGIKSFEIIIKNSYTASFPIESIFKNIHANQEIPVVKYNPGYKRENLYRLYTKNPDERGIQMPVYDKRKIINATDNQIAHDEIIMVIKPNNDITYNNLSLIFNNKGKIVIKGSYVDFLKCDSGATILESLIGELHQHVQPKIDSVNNFLELTGYRIKNFESQNIVVQNVGLVYDIDIEEKLTKKTLNDNIYLFKPIFSTDVVKQEGTSSTLEMRFKRVNNYKEPGLDEDIMEFLDNNADEQEIQSYIMNKYDLNDIIAIGEIERVRNNNMYEIKTIKQGFKTQLTTSSYGKNKSIVYSFINVTSLDYFDILKQYVSAISLLILQPEKGVRIIKMAKELRGANELRGIEEEEEEEIEYAEPNILDSLENNEFINIEKNAPNDFYTEDEDIDIDTEDEDIDIDTEDEDIDIDTEDEDEEIKGGEKNKREIKNYFDERKRRLNPDIFNHIEYSRTCPNNQDKQPVPITSKEKRKLKGVKNIKQDLNKTDVHYICPRFWDMKNDTVVSQEEAKTLKKYIIPKKGKINDDQYIYEFFDKVVHKSQNDDTYKNLQPYDTNVVYNIDGTSSGPFPCCGAKITSEKSRQSTSSYITNYDSHKRLLENQMGFLPEVLEKNVFELDIKSQLNKSLTELDKVKKGITLLRCGAELSINQSFIACIAKIKNTTFKNLKTELSNHITIDNYPYYNNGILYSMFLPKDLNLNYELTPADKDSEIYKEFININSDTSVKDYVINENKREVLATELSTFFKMLLASYNSFKEYLSNDDYIIDHTLLLDIILKNDYITDAFIPNINIVIFEINGEKLDVLIPANSDIKYDEKYDTAFILKRNNLYENISQCEYKDIKRFIIKKTNTDANETIKNIRSKTDEIINQIIKLRDEIVQTKKDTNGVFRPLKILYMKPILENNNYKIDHQIVNNQFVTTGIIVKLINSIEDKEYFIPSALEPPVDIDGEITIDNDNGIQKYLQSVDETKRFYSNLSKTKLVIKLDKVLYYDNDNKKEIYGFLTNTLQFVPTKKELLTDQWPNERAINIAHYYSADRMALLADNTVKYKKIHDARLETMYYNVFRAIMRYIISNEGLTEKRAEVKVMKDKIYNKDKNSNKRVEIEIILKNLMSSKITFVAKDNYKRPAKYTDITTCITQNNDKKVCDSISDALIIPKNNLNEPGLDNEKYYYTRLADELMRYSHVRKFILEPNVHLNIADDITHINDDEIIATETTLRNDIQFSEKTVGTHYPIYLPYKLAHSQKK
jgi:hypothetical protein